MATQPVTSTLHNSLLRRRLLRDISEIQESTYPGIALHVQDDLSSACLILSPGDEPPLHLTIRFTQNYPLDPPAVTIQSTVSHPNVFGDEVCISLLSCEEGYTPAYTLKGVAIQLLSFFFSDTVEQMYGEHGGRVDRKKWQATKGTDGYGFKVSKDTFTCKDCDFGKADHGLEAPLPKESPTSMPHTVISTQLDKTRTRLQLVDLPDDILLLFCDHLDDQSLLQMAAVCPNQFGRLIRQYNIFRTRELQCFVVKRGFNSIHLGIGVSIRDRSIASEFDILSKHAFNHLGQRHSVQGLPFEHFLPLPLSQMHWRRVKAYTDECLTGIARAAGIVGTLDKVLYSFMNNVVVRLSAATDEVEKHRGLALWADDGDIIRSSLTHASEKAIESYFHLFHLLLCLATDRPSIASDANRLIDEFIKGRRDKASAPNIGFLLIAILISDIEVSETLTRAVINESITRNVVWMLEAMPKGKGYPELSFMETSDISEYRLQKTFDAGKTSYRLLMFLNLMRTEVRAIRNNSEGQKLTLVDLREKLFKRHGAPPAGAVARMAQRIRDIQKVNDFPNFLTNMGIVQLPNKSSFSKFLRGTVQESMDKGYSRWALSQGQALQLRIGREGQGFQAPYNMAPLPLPKSLCTFFPGHGGGRGGGRGGDRGGRGGGRGRH